MHGHVRHVSQHPVLTFCNSFIYALHRQSSFCLLTPISQVKQVFCCVFLPPGCSAGAVSNADRISAQQNKKQYCCWGARRGSLSRREFTGSLQTAVPTTSLPLCLSGGDPENPTSTHFQRRWSVQKVTKERELTRD